MRRETAVLWAVFVAALLVGAFSVAATAAVGSDPDPTHMNGYSIDDVPKATYQLLGVAPLPEGRFLQLVLVTEDDTVFLLVVLIGPDGQGMAVLPW